MFPHANYGVCQLQPDQMWKDLKKNLMADGQPAWQAHLRLIGIMEQVSGSQLCAQVCFFIMCFQVYFSFAVFDVMLQRNDLFVK